MKHFISIDSKFHFMTKIRRVRLIDWVRICTQILYSLLKPTSMQTFNFERHTCRNTGGSGGRSPPGPGDILEYFHVFSETFWTFRKKWLINLQCVNLCTPQLIGHFTLHPSRHIGYGPVRNKLKYHLNISDFKYFCQKDWSKACL